ncbi:DNA double-strand break repair nuclease NurA [Candidatus Dependentiae bacterium]
MLNRNDLIKQIFELTSKIFPNLQDQYNIAQNTWNKICNDDLFIQKIENSKSSFLIPRWDGNLTDTFDINLDIDTYSVFSVDGSQIYPDRNMAGARCFLINLGGCKIQYNKTKNSQVDFFSEPKVFLPQDLFLSQGFDNKVTFSSDFVDLKREELELKRAYHYLQNTELCFIDGTMIFWNLEGKQQEVKDYFLNSYLKYLHKFYERQHLVAGYISFTKSRELVNLIKLGLCRFTAADCIACHREYLEFPCNVIDNLIDSTIVKFFLRKNQRTTVFYSTSKIIKYYPDHLKPCFCYLHIGQEIIRLEFPYWIAQNVNYVNFICKIAIDQCIKGQGYPVVLAEAHEQAVVKGPDREFFYHLIQKIGIEQQRRFIVSKKSLKKRGIGI